MHKYIKFGLIPLVLVAAVVVYIAKSNSNSIEKPEYSYQDLKPVPVQFQVAATPSVPSTQRLGLNLSHWTSSGSEQYMRNVLKNPGFEGQIDRILVIVQRTDENSFSDGAGLGQPEGFWKNATYDIRSGASAGLKGTISDSIPTGPRGLPQYFSEKLPPLAENDVIAITKFSDPDPVGQWVVPQASQELVKVDTSHPFPGSLGKNSLALSPTDTQVAEVGYYLDTLAEQHGKLLECKGPWRLSLRIAAQGENGKLVANFKRQSDSKPFLNKEILPPAAQSIQLSAQDWQLVEYDFNPEDTGPAAPLQLLLSASTPHTTIYIDDIALGPIQAQNPESPWRQEAVDLIKSLRPSYIRDWQGQLADTMENRLATPFERNNYRQRNFGGLGENLYSYSIPEVLDLCRQVQANPWLIVPTTASDEELRTLGRYLAQNGNATQFSEVILEFGNENWNWLLRSAALPEPTAHGPVAERAFKYIAEGAGPNVNLRKMVNGQFDNPWMFSQFASSAFNADMASAGPYFFTTMTAGASDADNLKSLFTVNEISYKQIAADLKKANKKFATYGINLHTLSGNAPEAERERLVASAASGAALAKHLLVGMSNQASPQCLFCLTQVAVDSWEVPGQVSLLGLARDINTSQRLRPTGLAMQMLNEVTAGSLHAATPQPGSTVEANLLTVKTFRTADQWSAALVNGNPVPLATQVQFPEDGRALPAQAKVLEAHSPFANNEKSEQVKIAELPLEVQGRTIQVTIPAYGFVTLTSPAL